MYATNTELESVYHRRRTPAGTRCIEHSRSVADIASYSRGLQGEGQPGWVGSRYVPIEIGAGVVPWIVAETLELEIGTGIHKSARER